VHGAIGAEERIEHLGMLDGAEEIMMLVYKTDKKGLDEMRAGLRTQITPIQKAQEGK
jgi:hypothetical protein